jgi:hypothetical protein
MKYFIASILAFLAFIIPAQASAQESTTVTNGMRWNTLTESNQFPFDWCSIAAVGYDNLGNKVALSAGHCIANEPLDAPVYLYDDRAAGPVGTLSTRNTELDYVIIKLNPDVNIDSDGPRVRIDSIGPARPDLITCKDGATTGTTCGLTLWYTDDRVYTTAPMFSGDSGGALIMQGTQLIGINRAFTGVFEYVKASAILADLDSKGSVVGQGFRPVNN